MKRYFLSLLAAVLFAMPALAQSAGVSPLPYAGFSPDPGQFGDPHFAYIGLDPASDLLTAERLLRLTSPLAATDNGPGSTYILSLGVVPATLGGSGQTTLAASADAFLNATSGAAVASGDLLYYDGTHWHRLAKGTDGRILSLSGGVPVWSPSGAGDPSLTYITQSNETASLPNSSRLAQGTGISLSNSGNVETIAVDTAVVATTSNTLTMASKTLTDPQVTYSATEAIGMKGNSFTSHLKWADWAAVRTINIPDPGTDADVVETAGNQTLAGVKTFSSAPSFSTNTVTANGHTMTFPGTAQTLVGQTDSVTISGKIYTAPVFDSASTLTLNQTSGNYTIDWANPGAGRAYHIVDVGGAANFVMGATSLTYTNGGVAYGNGNVLAVTAAGSSGQPLLSTGAGAPSFGTLTAAFGGTGQTSYTTGDILHATGSTTLSKLALGSALNVLRVNAGATDVEWGAVPAAVTTKGDIFTYSTTNDRLPVGSNDQFLSAQSGQSTGLQWETMSGDATLSGGVLTLKNTGPGAGANAIPQSVTLDAQGRVTAITAGTTATSSPFTLTRFGGWMNGTNTAVVTANDFLSYGGNFFPNQVGTASGVNTAGGNYVNLATATTNAAVAGLVSGTADFTNGYYKDIEYQHGAVVQFKMATGANSTDIQNCRIFIGVTSADPTLSDTPPNHSAMFRYATGTDGTAFWRTVTKDGTTVTTTTTSQSIASNTAYTLTIDMTSASQIVFSVNGSVVATHTTHLPTASTNLGFVFAITNVSAGTARNIKFRKMDFAY